MILSIPIIAKKRINLKKANISGRRRQSARFRGNGSFETNIISDNMTYKAVYKNMTYCTH